MTSETGSAEANTTLVRESVEAFNAGDTNKLLTIVAPDIVIHYAEMPEPLRGRDTWQHGFELVKRAFPDLENTRRRPRRRQRQSRSPTDASRHPPGRVPRHLPDRSHDHIRQPRVLPRRKRPVRRRVDLLRYGIALLPAELT
jgi:hypothetical protein